jgi:class 3 adenylate cyclase
MAESVGRDRFSCVVTFLFTDVEGSTRRWETDVAGMRKALAAGGIAEIGSVIAYLREVLSNPTYESLVRRGETYDQINQAQTELEGQGGVTYPMRVGVHPRWPVRAFS